MPSHIGWRGTNSEYLTAQLMPRLIRTARNMNFNVVFRSVDNRTVEVVGYNIFIYPETKRAQGVSGTLTDGHVGRVHLKISPTNRIPGRRYDFNFSVSSTGYFDSPALIDRIKDEITWTAAQVTVIEPTHDQILAREAKMAENKKILLINAQKRAEMFDSLANVLSNKGFHIESAKEDEFFNVKLKSGIALKLEVLNDGIKIKDMELPSLWEPNNELIDLLNAFSENKPT